MKFNRTAKELRDRGYRFQKLYGMNYKCYHKVINSHHVWCWVRGNVIEIDDWYGHTGNVAEFIDQNRDLGGAYLRIWYDLTTGELLVRDMLEYYEALADRNLVEAYHEKYKEYREIAIHLTSWDAIKEELNWLTNKENI